MATDKAFKPEPVDRITAGRGVATPIDMTLFSTRPSGLVVPTSANTAQDMATGYFDPLTPMTPTAPATVQGRRLDIPSGYNLQIRTRPYEVTTFAVLRNLADGWDLLRTIIETRKDQMERLQWNIVSRDPKAKGNDARIAKAEAFFRRPDKRNSWAKWLRQRLEDLFVIDAPALWLRRDRGGNLYALEIMNGDAISVKVDSWGRTPAAPATAYQFTQVGQPAVDYTVPSRDTWRADGPGELLYSPRNLRPHKFYGYSPVEQILMTVNIAMRRQMFQLQYYTEGNIPESLIGVPETWSIDQIREFQTWWDSLLMGNLAERRRARFVPGGVAKGYTPTKTDEIFGKAEEWLARMACFAFSISPQPFTAQQNRATAETAQEVALEEGLAPIQAWVKDDIDMLLDTEFDSADLEFKWADDKELDQAAQQKIISGYTAGAVLAVNEGRAMMGLDPFIPKTAPGEEPPVMNPYDVPMIISPTGVCTPLSLPDNSAPKPGDMIGPDGQPIPPTDPRHPANPANPANQQPANDVAHEGGEEPGKGGGASQSAAPAKSGSAGKKNGLGGGGTSGSDATEKSLLPDGLRKIAKGEPGKPLPPNPKLQKRAAKSVQRTMKAALSETGDDVAGQVSKALRKAGLKKAADPTDHGDGKSNDDRLDAAVDLQALVAELDLSSLEAVSDALQDDLYDVASDSALRALAQVGVRDPERLTDQVYDRAVAWAKGRAAELVGKRVLADGSVIDNPNPKFAITDSTRNMVRDTIAKGLQDNIGIPAIADALQESYAFSAERAWTIANTEVGNATQKGALQGYIEARADGVNVQKGWLTAGDDKVDEDICEANEDQGPIDLDDDFQSGDDAPLGHPECRCSLIPFVDDSSSSAGDDDEQDDG